jgi:hypothetical protein
MMMRRSFLAKPRLSAGPVGRRGKLKHPPLSSLRWLRLLNNFRVGDPLAIGQQDARGPAHPAGDRRLGQGHGADAATIAVPASGRLSVGMMIGELMMIHKTNARKRVVSDGRQQH